MPKDASKRASQDGPLKAAPSRVDSAGIIIALVLTGIAGILVWDASALQSNTLYGIGPQTTPIAVAVGLGVLAIANLFDALRGDLPPRESLDVKAVLLILGGLALLIGIIGVGGGFILATTALFIATSSAFGRRAILTDFAVGFTMATLVYLAFNRLLTLSLPNGPLERLL